MKPRAWLHTLHMEHNQADVRVTLDAHSPFGEPGEDYDLSYTETSEPLYAADKSVIASGDEALPIPDGDVPREVANELLRCAMHGNISYRYLLDIYRKGRDAGRAAVLAEQEERAQQIDEAMRRSAKDTP